jgi:hypothetical protein
MRFQNWLSVGCLALFVLALVGCDSPKQVITPADKKGISDIERKDKRGE